MRFEKNPLFIKASEITELIGRVTDFVKKGASDQSDEYTRETWIHLADFLHKDAMMMTAKVAGALGADFYDLQMENASIIRKCGKDILIHLTGLEIHGFKDKEYLDIIRKEIDEFRILFAEWVETFDPWNYVIDSWGLFNPPGVRYDDPETEDNIPFHLDFDEIDDLGEINPDDWDELDEEDGDL